VEVFTMRAWAVLLVTMGASAASVSPVRACSCVITALYQSDPANGATGVPLNQALAIEGVFAPSSVRLQNERGEAVPFELNAGPWPACEGTSADVIPREPLQPNTRYTLRVDALYPDAYEPPQATATLEFRTGTTSLPEISLAVPSLSATVVRDGPPAMCGTGTHTVCIGTSDSAGTELIMRRGSTVLLRTTTLVRDSGSYALAEIPDCIELRRRAPTGKRSEPFRLCGDDLRVQGWTKDDNDEFDWPRCESGETPSSRNSKADDGCTLGTNGLPSWMPLTFALCLTMRRRRARARARTLTLSACATSPSRARWRTARSRRRRGA
jgi:hypothetical protein